jgi:hypothetical protein
MNETAPSGQNAWPRFVVAAAVPIAVAGLADLLWWISDRLGDVGPLDRAAFGWVVVIPVWIAAPVAAGFAWRTIDRRTTGAIAALVGTVVAVVAAVLLWQSIAFPSCETGAILTPLERVQPSLPVGAMIGAGWRSAAWYRRGSRDRHARSSRWSSAQPQRRSWSWQRSWSPP